MEQLVCSKCGSVENDNDDTMEAVPGGDCETIYLCPKCLYEYSVCYYCHRILRFDELERCWNPDEEGGREKFFMRNDDHSGHACKECIAEEGLGRCIECGTLGDEVFLDDGVCYPCQQELERRELEQ